MVTQQKKVSQWTLTFSLHIANYSEFELYLPDENFEAIASKIEAFFTCLTPVEPKIDLWLFL